MNNKPDEAVLWKKLFRTIEMIRNYHSKSLGCSPHKEITFTQVQIITCVLFAPEQHVRVRDIAEEIGITPGAVSQQVERLVQIDLLERKTDGNDRRAVAITLSKKGQEMSQQLDVFFTALFHRLLGNVPPEKMEIFSELLDIMMSNMAVEKQKLNKINKETEK